jgi:transcription initiation factor TFIID TATA-box-binding protein
VFSPGKVVCTGAKTEAVGHYAIMETLAYIREKGFPRACPLSNSLEAENVVGTIEFDFGLDIDALYANHPSIVSYNKEAFPGATVRPPQIFPAAQLAFESGKTVTMGARGREGLMRILSVTFALYYDIRKERKRKTVKKKKKKTNLKKRQRRAEKKE